MVKDAVVTGNETLICRRQTAKFLNPIKIDRELNFLPSESSARRDFHGSRYTPLFAQKHNGMYVHCECISEVYEMLWRMNHRTEIGQSFQSCFNFDLPHTLTISSGEIDNWYFTSKQTGQILKKSKKHIDWDNIFNSFCPHSVLEASGMTNQSDAPPTRAEVERAHWESQIGLQIGHALNTPNDKLWPKFTFNTEIPNIEPPPPPEARKGAPIVAVWLPCISPLISIQTPLVDSLQAIDEDVQPFSSLLSPVSPPIPSQSTPPPEEPKLFNHSPSRGCSLPSHHHRSLNDDSTDNLTNSVSQIDNNSSLTGHKSDSNHNKASPMKSDLTTTHNKRELKPLRQVQFLTAADLRSFCSSHAKGQTGILQQFVRSVSGSCVSTLRAVSRNGLLSLSRRTCRTPMDSPVEPILRCATFEGFEGLSARTRIQVHTPIGATSNTEIGAALEFDEGSSVAAVSAIATKSILQSMEKDRLNELLWCSPHDWRIALHFRETASTESRNKTRLQFLYATLLTEKEFTEETGETLKAQAALRDGLPELPKWKDSIFPPQPTTVANNPIAAVSWRLKEAMPSLMLERGSRNGFQTSTSLYTPPVSSRGEMSVELLSLKNKSRKDMNEESEYSKIPLTSRETPRLASHWLQSSSIPVDKEDAHFNTHSIAVTPRVNLFSHAKAGSPSKWPGSKQMIGSCKNTFLNSGKANPLANSQYQNSTTNNKCTKNGISEEGHHGLPKIPQDLQWKLATRNRDLSLADFNFTKRLQAAIERENFADSGWSVGDVPVRNGLVSRTRNTKVGSNPHPSLLIRPPPLKGVLRLRGKVISESPSSSPFSSNRVEDRRKVHEKMKRRTLREENLRKNANQKRKEELISAFLHPSTINNNQISVTAMSSLDDLTEVEISQQQLTEKSKEMVEALVPSFENSQRLKGTQRREDEMVKLLMAHTYSAPTAKLMKESSLKSNSSLTQNIYLTNNLEDQLLSGDHKILNDDSIILTDEESET